MFLQSFFQESDCDIGADAVASGSGIAKSNDSVDQADGAGAVDLKRAQTCALDEVVGADGVFGGHELNVVALLPQPFLLSLLLILLFLTCFLVSSSPTSLFSSLFLLP